MKNLIIKYVKDLTSFLSENIELIFWVGGLIYLTIITPDQNHFTLCPLKNVGLHFCPGCGLGQSISFIFHLKIFESFKAHPLGLFALIIIIFRIIQLIKTKLRREHYA